MISRRQGSYDGCLTVVAGRDAVLMKTRFDGPHSDQLYVRLDPLAGGTGGGGSQNAGPNSALIASKSNRPCIRSA